MAPKIHCLGGDPTHCKKCNNCIKQREGLILYWEHMVKVSVGSDLQNALEELEKVRNFQPKRR